MAKTYQLGRTCPLCDRRIPDDHRSDFCCGKRVPVMHVQVATGHNPDEVLEDLELTHTKVINGQRRWAGRGSDGRRVVWDEYAA